MRKLIAFLVFLSLLLPAGLSAAVTVSPPEAPAPARVHIAPEPPAGAGAILNLARDRNALDGVRFKLDARFLHVWFPLIANADEAVIVLGDEVWLIDCGDKGMGQRGVRMMEELGIRKIDKLFNTHPHHDHIEGLQVTNEAIPVGELLICFPEEVSETMVAAMDYAKEAGIPVTHYTSGETFTMGDGLATLKFFFPEDDSLDMNNRSAQTLLEYGSRRMMFTADMERPGQEALLSFMDPEDLRTDILKYPHHGKTGLLQEYYEAVNPALAVITNVNVDWAGIEYLKLKQIPYLFTCSKDAYVHLYTDGSSWVVEYVPMGTAAPLFPADDSDAGE